MAVENQITIIGNLADDPELRYTQSGVAVANVRVAVNRRKRNQDTNEWEDQLDGFFTCNVWREQAENVAESLSKGDRVLVLGRLRSRSYENKEGETRWVTEVEADEITPSLRWARAQVTRNPKGGGPRPTGGGGGQRGGGSSQPAEPDPFAAGVGAGSDDQPF